MDFFMDFFQKKTGIDWHDRVTLEGFMPANYFQYACPVCLWSLLRLYVVLTVADWG